MDDAPRNVLDLRRHLRSAAATTRFYTGNRGNGNAKGVGDLVHRQVVHGPEKTQGVGRVRLGVAHQHRFYHGGNKTATGNIFQASAKKPLALGISEA